MRGEKLQGGFPSEQTSGFPALRGVALGTAHQPFHKGGASHAAQGGEVKSATCSDTRQSFTFTDANSYL